MTTLALTRRFGFPTIADGSSQLGLPAERTAKQRLSGSADEVVKTITKILDEMILEVISSRTTAEFNTALVESFPKYVDLVMSYARIVSSIVPKGVQARLVAESFSEFESEIRADAEHAFGNDMRDRAVFTVWTLRKISDLLELAASKDVSDGDKGKDQEFLNRFLLHALRSRFSVDCLRLSMRTKTPIYPDVLPELADGLRSAVDAYAWIRQAVELRAAGDEDSLPAWSEQWDLDDQTLVNESMQDLANERD
jgi:hypothetical protein